MAKKPLMDEINAAIGMLHAGEKSEARVLLLDLWRRLGDDADPYLRSTAAHFIADTQEDVAAELSWDLAALAAATVCDEFGAVIPATDEVAAFLPSLHLNVGDAYRRMGDFRRALMHANAGRECAEALGTDGYAAMIRTGLNRLHDRVNHACDEN